MKKSEYELLEEAYLSVSNKNQTPETSSEVSTDPNPVVSVGPMDEPAPGVDVNVSEISPDTAGIDKDTTGVPVDMTAGDAAPSVDLEQEDEEDQMSLENLNSIRDSIMKIAGACASGGHLEIWAQQKLAIAMDNLAEVARRLH